MSLNVHPKIGIRQIPSCSNCGKEMKNSPSMIVSKEKSMRAVCKECYGPEYYNQPHADSISDLVFDSAGVVVEEGSGD